MAKKNEYIAHDMNRNDMIHDMMTRDIKNNIHRGVAHSLLRSLLVLALLLLGVSGVKATDYVISYSNGGTTYYLGMNGNSLQAKTTFDLTCIWTCRNGNNDASLGSTSYSLRNKNNNTYYLTTSCTRSGSAFSRVYTWAALSVQNSANNIWRSSSGTNGNVYAYVSGGSGLGSWTRNASINVSSLSMIDDNTNSSQNYTVTTSTVTTTSTAPTISGTDVITTTGNTNYTASGASYQQGGYTNYRFNNTDHFFNGNTAITPAAANVSYSWGLTTNAYATVNNSGVVNVSSLPESDVTLTLTVTATFSGGTPSVPSGTTLSATKDITILGTKPSAPIITINGTSVTMSTDAAGSTSIRYTLDGTDPTATTGTVYSGAIDLSSSTTSPVTIKAVTVRNGNASDVTTETVTLTLPAPTITVDGSAGTATISATSGATIYYTTDGSDPTTSSTQYSAPLSNLAAMTTIKAIAVKTGWNNSPVASETVSIPSGVSGGTVTLFDYEDHNWTYYSGVDSSVDGGNYNTNYVGKMYSPNPRNVKITYNGVNGITGSSTTVKISTSEDETSFVYYKTLEQGSTTGEYPYQVISNPFSVRPSTGSGNSKVYYGFAGWKIVSGGEYIKNHNNNDVLSLDEEIVFNNLPYPSVNCTSAEIVFETTWTQANVQTGNNIGTMLGQFSGGTYETNFAVLTGNYTTAWTGNKNATITSVLPDGSADYRGAYTRLNVTVNSGYTIKYEYININDNSSTLSMGSGTKTLYIGRGVSNTTANGVVCNLIQGYNESINSGGLTYTLKIESGIYNYLTYIKGYEGSGTSNTVTGTVSVKGVLGCDYDRAKNDNTKLKIQQQIIMGYGNSSSTALLQSATAGQEVLNVTFKSGSLHSSLTSAGTADANQSFYIGVGNSYCPGYRIFTMEGGEMWSLAAGLCQNTATTNSVRFRIKGGLIKGSIYGSAANANSYGYKQMILTGGQVKGWIAGGGNGTSANGGTTTGSSYVYVGGNCRVDSEGSTTKINSSLGGQVFGSGSGVENTTTWGEMLYGTNVVVADNAYIERNVFGGGNFGWTDEYANIYLTGEGMSVGKVFGGANQNKGDNVRIYMTGGNVREGLYGGSNTTGTINNNVEMHINGGQVGTSSSPANIHGGGYGSPTRVSQNVEITLGVSGQTTPGVTVYGDVYGGSALGYVNGTAATNTYHTYVTLNKGTIHGSLYGGGLGDGSTAANVYGPVQVKVYGGSVKKTDSNGANGSGGVYGANNVNGAPQRSVTVDIYGTDPAPSANEYALFAVYGGGNAADYTYGNGYPKVTVHNCDNSIEYVYGGGNAAAVAATDVKIYGGNTIGTVFGGGNGSVTAANVTGSTSVNIYGGTIGHVFGGSNSQGTIGGTINVNVNKQADTDPEGSSTACDMKIYELYGGGNKANSNVGSITIGCTGDLTAGHSEHPENIGTTLEGIGYVYGGANQANITGDITLTMNSGIVGNLFGGNNTSGTISGGIQVNVEKNNSATCASNWYLGNVFGGGNLAPYTIPSGKALAVNILNGTVSQNVYGGGKGDPNDHSKGQVTGNPVVTIGDNVAAHQVTIAGSVFGGGDAGNVSGTPEVDVIEKCNTEITTAVYGGGNAADVTGTNVTINGGTIGDVFGGGNGAVAAANVTGTTSLVIHGGTINRVFAGGNTAGTIGTNSGVTINHSSSCDQSINEVYGGGNLAAGNAGTVAIQCGAENIGDVYGGANQADVTNDITLNITGGQINNVFGGNNTSGSISGGITVNINKATDCNTFSVNNVYGGGNLAQYTIPNNKALAVNILNGTISQNVYGGGKGLASDHSKGQVTGNPVVTIGDADRLNNNSIVAAVTGDVYGGGDAGNVVGTPVVNVINKCNTTIGNVYGGGNAADVNGTDVNIDGGTITGMVFGGGHGDKNSNPQKQADVNGNVAVDVTGGTINKVFGGSNSKGDISGTVAVTINKGNTSCEMHITEVYGGGNEAAGNAGTVTIGCTGDYENNGEGITNVYGGANAADINNNISLTISGGHIDNVYGGNNTSGSISGTITVNVNWDDALTCGKYLGNVFGGGNQAVYTAPTATNESPNAHNYPAVNILKGTVSGDVFGGGYGNANDATKGVVNGNPQVNINGANATVVGGVYGGGSLAPTNGNPVVTLTNGSTTKVFGGGKAAGITGAPTVNINGGSVTTGVYGGCDSSGNVTGNIIVNINGGTLGVEGTPLTSGIFGGGYGSSTTTGGDVTVNVGDANAASAAATSTIYGDIYGGSALGTVNDAVADVTTVNFNNGTLHGNIYGGGLGAATLDANGYIASVTTEATVNGTVHVNIGTSTQASNFVTIDGQVFGCNNLAGSPKGPVYVDVYKTAHTAANSYPDPEPSAAADVTEQAATAFAISAVYGGGNLAHYTTTTEGASTHVRIHGCDNTIQYVYGGGNAANSPATDVVIDGGRFNYIFGGGNGAGTGNPGANIAGNATVTLDGGIIYRAFGGSNTRGNIGGTSSVNLPDVTTCTRLVHEIFGGGNEAPGGSVDMTIPCGTTGTGIVYAGANNADMGTETDFNNGNPVLIKLTVEGGDFTQVFGGNNQGGTIWGNVELYLKGGTIANAFGGNNLGGNIKGTIKVYVEDAESATCPLILTNVYGGGYNAAYTPVDSTIASPQVYVNHIKQGNKILGSVFGGGYGAPATVTANPVVTIGDTNANHYACITGSVFGGGDAADVVGSTSVLMQNAHSETTSIFGGGNEADILRNTTVNMTGGTVKNRVFGGGNLGGVGTITARTTPSGHSHSGTCIQKPNTWTANTGKCIVNISGGTVGDTQHMTMPDDYGYVFGASRGESADPATNPDIDFTAYVYETQVTISNTAFIIGGVYGGSENGHVRGDTKVYIKGGQIGCGNGKTAPYAEADFINPATSTAAQIEAKAATMTECSSWNYTSPFATYDANNATTGGATTGSDGHTFYGNVFGGGSGYWPYKKADDSYEWNMKAGLVEGNTYVEITGGHILTSVYGGNELTNVEGNCHVKMSGGTIGIPRTLAQIAAHPVTCFLFGAGKGDPRTHFNQSTNVGNVIVEINDSVAQPIIYGSVYGGGEDGHVTGNVYMNIWKKNSNDPVIGTWGTSYLDGNVFGAGRGFTGEALTAGVVQGNVNMYISGGKILGSVYGGGRLASAGTYLVPADNANYGKLMGSTGDTTHGNITINISGGTIGNDYEYIFPSGDWTQSWKETNHIPNTEFGSSGTDKNRLMHTKGGNVFAGSMGRLYHLDGSTPISNWPDMGKVRKTVLNISGGTIKSNVYGGGELGTVAEGTTINVTGGTIGTEVSDGSDIQYTFGSVYGGGYGSSLELSGSLNDTRSTVIARDYAARVTGNTDVNISGSSTRIWASVYGGGELAWVDGNTDVNVAAGHIGKEVLNGNYVKYGGYRMGNVFGGGRGSLDYEKAGLVTGNATVLISGGNIYHNIYGGGALGSVGTFTYDATTGLPTACAANTGQTSVTITGGIIGINGHDNGMVNGSSRGDDGRPVKDGDKYSALDRVAWVNNSVVTIGTSGQGTNFDNPHIWGSVYGGGENGHNQGNTNINLHSGTVGNMDPNTTWHHGNIYGAGCGTDTYTYNNETYYNPIAGLVRGNATFNLTGGRVVNDIYGSGSMGTTEGNSTFNITGGRILGNVFGGAKGEIGAKAEDPNVLLSDVGGNAQLNINYASTPVDDNGNTIYIIEGSVFGGGEAGPVKGSVEVNIRSGLIMKDVYGGGALTDSNINNATNYGKSNESITSTSTYTTTVNLTGGKIRGNVYGGGLGDADNPARVYGDVAVTLNGSALLITNTTDDDNNPVPSTGRIFGCNNVNGTPLGTVTVTVLQTKHYDHTEHFLNDYEVGAVYGGGNLAGYEPYNPNTPAKVIVNGCTNASIEYVYGGGNAAPVPASDVLIQGAFQINYLFGGGNGKDKITYDGGTTWAENPGADVGLKKDGTSYGNGDKIGTTNVVVNGGRIRYIFGGSNTKGNVTKDAHVYLDDNGDCPLNIEEVYGAGNDAYMDGASNITLGCISSLNSLYGGSKNAYVGGDIVLTVSSGTFGRVFGGNNLGGNIDGSITVNIEETGCHPIIIGELYGGGNQAAYSVYGYNTDGTPKTSGTKAYADPEVNIKSFTSIASVFGGGYGAGAIIYGDTNVNVDVTDGRYAANSYAGGSIAGSGQITPAKAAGAIGVIHDVFGGGNQAKVQGNTNVKIGTKSTVTYEDASVHTVKGVSIIGDVFGGGNQAEVTGNTNVVVGKSL